jgi:hypothetical protein
MKPKQEMKLLNKVSPISIGKALRLLESAKRYKQIKGK